MFAHEPELVFFCRYCDHTFADRMLLYEHEMIHKRYACAECGKRFFSSQCLHSHKVSGPKIIKFFNVSVHPLPTTYPLSTNLLCHFLFTNLIICAVLIKYLLICLNKTFQMCLPDLLAVLNTYLISIYFNKTFLMCL